MARKPLSPSTKLALGVGAFGLGFGLLIGTGLSPDPVTPKPKTVTVTETKEVVKQVTPIPCLSALTYADAVNEQTMMAFDLFSKSATAIQVGQYGVSDLILADVRTLTPKLLANRAAYASTAADCRAVVTQ